MSDIKQLYERFNAAYRDLRAAWLKTGGGMDLALKVRDAAAEVEYRRRAAAARCGAARRRARRGIRTPPREVAQSFPPNFNERSGIR